MKVYELITKLSTCPAGATVLIAENDSRDLLDVNEVSDDGDGEVRILGDLEE